MKPAGPLLTLAAAAALSGGLLIANTATHGGTDSATARTAVTTSAAPSAPVTTRPGFPAQADYVTVIATAGRPITLSVTITGAKAVAYACDGAAVESWLKGAADAGRTTLSGNNSRLEAQLAGASLAGSLLLDGKTYDFTAPPAAAPAGLYLADSAAGRDSWIVAPDGSVTGVRRNPNGSTTAAPELAPNARKVHGDDNDF
ncbi:hypothetical protein [Nocardia inohanensis]|uniref:hypothetical protein n=1 Tax=Nocardia inohanensis TaxID=209246 RepID=UPI00082E2CAF|nr:hypothetical protein [Nocardia inohanensis]